VLYFLAAALSLFGTAASPRATVDMPDDVSGAQVHFVYAVPADGADRQLDTNGVLAGSVASWENWLIDRTSRRMLRLDTFHGAADITFVRLSQTDAQIASLGAFVREQIETDLKAMGLVVPGKIYGVYYDGSSIFSCGGGAWPPTLPGVVGALYLHGMPPGAPACDTNQFRSASQPPAYLEFAMLHELMHTLGFVPTCAPHQVLAGHVSDSNTDLMYAGPLPWAPSALDVGNDDYFDAHIPGCLDFADSPFLTDALKQTVKVMVSVIPARSGTVSGLVSCRSVCSAVVASGAQVTLKAKPERHWRFLGWDGAGCSGRGVCRFQPTDDAAVTARFRRVKK